MTTASAESRDRAGAPSKGPTLIYFMLGETVYAIDMRWISKVEPEVSLTPVPCVPAFVAGLTRVGEQIMTVIDLRQFLEVSGETPPPRSQIVVEVEGRAFSILSDTLPGFITLEQSLERADEDPFSILLGRSSRAGDPVFVLDVEKMFWLLSGRIDKLEERMVQRLTESRERAAAEVREPQEGDAKRSARDRDAPDTDGPDTDPPDTGAAGAQAKPRTPEVPTESAAPDLEAISAEVLATTGLGGSTLRGVARELARALLEPVASGDFDAVARVCDQNLPASSASALKDALRDALRPGRS